MMITTELGGRHFAKGVILSWLVDTGGSNINLLETATGLPKELLKPLLIEMMIEGAIKLDRIIFKPVRR